MSFSKTNLEFGLDYQVFIIQYKDNAVVPNVKYPKEGAQFLKKKKNHPCDRQWPTIHGYIF